MKINKNKFKNQKQNKNKNKINKNKSNIQYGKHCSILLYSHNFSVPRCSIKLKLKKQNK